MFYCCFFSYAIYSNILFLLPINNIGSYMSLYINITCTPLFFTITCFFLKSSQLHDYRSYPDVKHIIERFISYIIIDCTYVFYIECDLNRCTLDN